MINSRQSLLIIEGAATTGWLFSEGTCSSGAFHAIEI